MLEIQVSFNKLNAFINGICVGILVGIITSAFRFCIEKLFSAMIFLYHLARYDLKWAFLIIFINLIIGFIVGLIMHRDPDIKGSGIPQSQGQITGQLRYPWFKTLYYKFISSVLTVGSGIFLGPEGPSIQIGASAAQGFAILRTDNHEERRIIMASGVAAGLTTVFNAPIASTLFVLEGIYRDFSSLVSLTALTAAVISNFISMGLFGETPLFHISHLYMYPLHYYWILAILGLVIGIAGYFYQQISLKINAMKIKFRWLPSDWNVLIPLILVIPFGIWTPMVIGSGNRMIIYITHFQVSIGIAMLYLVLRFVLSEIAFSSKAPGGIFVPMLVIGGTLGNVLGIIFIHLGMLSSIYLANIVIVSMVGFFASISQTPFTSIILITEMVGTLQHMMALAFVTIIAYLVADLLGNGPFYDLMLKHMLGNHFINLDEP